MLIIVFISFLTENHVTAQNFSLSRRKVHATELTHAPHTHSLSLSYHSVTTLADDEILPLVIMQSLVSTLELHNDAFIVKICLA